MSWLIAVVVHFARKVKFTAAGGSWRVRLLVADGGTGRSLLPGRPDREPELDRGHSTFPTLPSLLPALAVSPPLEKISRDFAIRLWTGEFQ